jgi:hypothetical protein
VYTRLVYIVHSISIPKEKKDKGKAFPPFLFRVLVVLVDTRSGSIVPPSLSLSFSLWRHFDIERSESQSCRPVCFHPRRGEDIHVRCTLADVIEYNVSPRDIIIVVFVFFIFFFASLLYREHCDSVSISKDLFLSEFFLVGCFSLSVRRPAAKSREKVLPFF